MSELSINTTQNVNIKFTSASFGERFVAKLLDYVIQIAYVIVVYYIFFDWIGLDEQLNRMDHWSQMAIVIAFGLPILLYSVVQESLLEGQTLGKKIAKIKVIKLDGYQAGVGDYLIRWLFILIDISIGSGVIGLISIIVTNKNQRLGDLAAGTAVISLKNNININHTILEEIEEDFVPTYPLVIKLSDNDVRIIKDTFYAALKSEDFSLIYKLREKIETVTGIKSDTYDSPEFITTVLKDYNYYTRNM